RKNASYSRRPNRVVTHSSNVFASSFRCLADRRYESVQRIDSHRPSRATTSFAVIGKYFDYPITAKDVVARLGLWESMRCTLSYLRSARHRNDDAKTFEEWVTTRFGRRLYDAFF